MIIEHLYAVLQLQNLVMSREILSNREIGVDTIEKGVDDKMEWEVGHSGREE